MKRREAPTDTKFQADCPAWSRPAQAEVRPEVAWRSSARRGAAWRVRGRGRKKIQARWTAKSQQCVLLRVGKLAEAACFSFVFRRKFRVRYLIARDFTRFFHKTLFMKKGKTRERLGAAICLETTPQSFNN